jgi:hypothetical protein
MRLSQNQRAWIRQRPLQAGKHGAEAAQGRAASQVPPAKNSFGAQDKKEARVLKIFGIIPFGNFSNSQNFFMGPDREWPRLPIQYQGGRRRAIRRGRHSISARLAGRGADPSRSPRPVAARGSETDFRATLGFANHVASTRKTPGIAATPWETSRKLSRTSPWSAPRSTWTARWGPADHETRVVERRCRPRNAVSRLIRAGAPSA